jgi:hypothetical protein
MERSRSEETEKEPRSGVQGAGGAGGGEGRKAMINPDHELSISRQATILEISRSSVYYTPTPVSPADLELMKAIDRLHLEAPFAGSRMLKKLLAALDDADGGLLCRGAGRCHWPLRSP